MPHISSNVDLESSFAKIKIGDLTEGKHGRARITCIELMPIIGQKEGGIEMQEVWTIDKDRCVFDLDNGHWAYGDQIRVLFK